MRFHRSIAVLTMLALWGCAHRPAPVIHTPWLALRFIQDGAEAPMVRRNLYLTEVQLRRAPFRLLLARRGADDTYRIAAAEVDAVFEPAHHGRSPRGADSPEPLYFSPGSGIADTGAGSGTLYLNPEGHNHLTGLRLGPDRERHEVQFSTLFVEGREIPMDRVIGPIFLVAYLDEDGDQQMENGEYDLIRLDFAG